MAANSTRQRGAMFVLAALEDDVRVEPRDLSKTPLAAVTDALEARYLDRVISGLGLAVSVYDVQGVEGGQVYPNDGAAYFRARFRLVVFRPFVGEVLTGTLAASTRDGLRISLGFFEDVQIPDNMMQEPSLFRDDESLWVWSFEGQDMYMDLQEEVRFKVMEVRFRAPPTPAEMSAAQATAEETGGPPPPGTAANPLALMEVVGDINGDGLGLTSWWVGDEGGGEDADADGAASMDQ